MTTGSIGYYVHHAGAGHGALGTALAAVLRDRLVGFGSGGRPAGWGGRWFDLPRDDVPAVEGDPTRGGAWHWVPAGHAGYAARMQAIAGWIAETRPGGLVSDVSCEVAVLGALLGVPTAAVVLPGRRDDGPHRLAFASADVLAAPWPVPVADPVLAPWAATLAPLGLISRFDGRTPTGAPGARRVLVLLPAGGHAIDVADVEAAARATEAAGWTWTATGTAPAAGGPVGWVGRVEDPWPLLGRADVVVAGCGLGSVADIAAARRPAVLVPQDRPFDEQRALACHLEGRAPVVVAPRWPPPDAWAALLDRAAALDPGRWAPLHDGCGAARFAAELERMTGVSPDAAAASGPRCPTSPPPPAPSGPNRTPPVGRCPATSPPTSSSSVAGSPG